MVLEATGTRKMAQPGHPRDARSWALVMVNVRPKGRERMSNAEKNAALAKVAKREPPLLRQEMRRFV